MRRHPWRAQELSVLLLAFAALVTARQLMCRGPLSSTSSRRTHRGRLAFDYPAYDTNPAQYASGGPPPPPPPPGGLYHAHPPPAQHQPHHQRSPERTGTPASGPGQYPPPPPPPPHHHQHQQAQQPPHPQDQWGGPGGYGQGGSPPPRQDGPGAEGPGRYDQGQPVGGENYGAYYGSQGEHGYGAYYGVPPGQGGQGGARTEGPSVGEKLKGLWGSFKEKIASGVDSVSKSSTVENGLRYLARDYDQPGGGSGGYYGGPVYDSQGGHQAPQSLPGGGAYGPPATHMHQSPQGAGSWSSPGRDGSGPGARYGPPSSRGVPPPPPPPAYFPPGEKQPLSYPPPSRQPAYPPREAGSPRTPHGPGTPAEEDEPSQHRIVNEMQDRYRAQGRRGEEDEATRHGWPTQPVPGPGPGPSGGRLGPGGPWGHPPPAQQPQASQYQQREGQRPGQGGAKAPPYVHGVDDRPPYFSQQQQQAFARPPPSQHGGFPHSQQDYGPPPPTSHGHGPPPPASSYPTPGPGHGAGTDAAPGTQQPQQAPQEEVQSQRPYPTLEEEGEGEKGKGESVPPASSAAGSYQGKDSTERTRPTGSARTSPSEEGHAGGGKKAWETRAGPDAPEGGREGEEEEYRGGRVDTVRSSEGEGEGSVAETGGEITGGGGEQREQGPGGEGGEVGQVGGHEEAEHAGRVQERKCDEEEAGSVLDAPTDWNQVREEQESPGGEGSGGGEGEGEDAGEVGLGESCASDLQQDPLYLQEVENQLESFWVEHMAAQQAAASGNAGGEDGGGRGQAEGSDLIYPQSSDPADYPSPYSVQGGSRHDVSAPTLSSQPSSYPESQHYGRYPPSEYALVPGDRSHQSLSSPLPPPSPSNPPPTSAPTGSVNVYGPVNVFMGGAGHGGSAGAKRERDPPRPPSSFQQQRQHQHQPPPPPSPPPAPPDGNGRTY